MVRTVMATVIVLGLLRSPYGDLIQPGVDLAAGMIKHPDTAIGQVVEFVRGPHPLGAPALRPPVMQVSMVRTY